jgi:hypothetical protein
MRRFLGFFVLAVLWSSPSWSQQTGSIAGRVAAADGSALPGVTVQASSDVLPRARVATSFENGDFHLPSLPPGGYTVTFTLEGMETVTQNVDVLLDQQSTLRVVMGPTAFEEQILVTAERALIDPSSTAIKSAVSEEMIEQVPLGQDYRDLQKLIPGVQYTELTTRGASAGGSGQDNVYQFDGVNVNLPLFGVLSAEPSNHDVEQVSIVKGGAKAVDFNRAGGFTIDTVSKSGTNRYHGELSYRLQDASLTADQEGEVTTFDEDRDWITLNAGGPIVEENLFLYGSYYRPTRTRGNQANAYGAVPDFESTRDEYFGKLTWTPRGDVLINGSYRDSSRRDTAASIGDFSAASTSEGSEVDLQIAIVEGSWVINDRNFASFKLSDFENPTASRPDHLAGFGIATDGSVGLNVSDLASQGHLFVPTPIAGQDAYNQFIAPIIQRYGFLDGGVPTGGGDVGFGSTIDNNDFFRTSYQGSYDYLFGENVFHELHVGYQYFKDEEDLDRTSNGWGAITVPGGRTTFNGQPVFYQAQFLQTSLAEVPVIHSEFESQNVELNDTIKWSNWSFNLGVLLSNDTYFGSGLREGGSNPSGFELAPGHKYKQYEVPWEDQIQPRLGATWAYNGRDTAYVSYARYNPAASSLPRAASWDRNLARFINAFFDADGNLIGSDSVRSSSGKFFQDDLEPRSVDEYLIGTSREINRAWTGRAYARYRKGSHFWEDTNNDARLIFEPPPGIPQELYIPDLDTQQQGIGGSSYVIAELDGAFTKFYEVSLDLERRTGDNFIRGSYTWSHYYGNFDQDDTTVDNDQAIFIGSSNIADGAGRQLWDMKYGDLHGDRRHLLKLYGFHRLPWNATVGAFGVYQSGEPWEAWDVEVYRELLTATGSSSTSNTIRFAEPAGSRKSDDHYQVDLNYTQSFPFGGRYEVQLIGDVFNVTDNQTGYAIEPNVHAAGFGEPTRHYAPRRFQLTLRFQL